jgi:hypothetical protein
VAVDAVLVLGRRIDVYVIFEETRAERLASEHLVKLLVAMEERPWSEWGKTEKPITQSGVAKFLKPFKIRPGTVRLGAGTAKGYKREDFIDAWSRYGVTQAVTPSQPTKGGHFRETDTVTSTEDVTAGKEQKPSSDGQCDCVTGHLWKRCAGSELENKLV